MKDDAAVLTAAAVFLAICLITFGYAARPGAAGYRHTILVFTWLCAALAATLVVFSMFPDSGVGGEFFGFTLGGAGAFVMLVWTAAIRAARVAGRRDDLDQHLRERDRRIAQLEAALARPARRPQPLVGTARHHYDVRDAQGRRLGIVTGDIRRTTCAEVWVNPENTNLSMADAYDDSISGIIRYEGARKDPLGHVSGDLIGDELERIVSGHRPVPAGAAVVTGAGELWRAGVRAIVHVAAVIGQPGEGYRQVRGVGRCATNALAAVDNAGAPLGSSVLVPLLGTGYGRGDVETTVRALVGAVVAYLAEHPGTAVTEVYLLAYTDEELTACRKVFAENDRLSEVAHSD